MSYTSTNQGYYSGGYDGFDDDEKSLLPRSLAWAVLVLGFASYLFRFGPLPTGHDASWGVRFAVLAALAAGFGLIPRQSTSHQVVAALAVAGFLDALAVRIGGSGGWALTVIAVLTGLQSVAAIGGLLQAHPADEQDQATAYQAYSEYWAQLQYYGQYAPTAEAPEFVHRAGQGHAGGQASAQAEAQSATQSAARAARPAAAQAAGYEGFVGNADPEYTAFIDRIPAQAAPPPGQAGLPYVGHAQAAAPTQRYGDTSGATATRASETR